jgi:hypothetical protein
MSAYAEPSLSQDGQRNGSQARIVRLSRWMSRLCLASAVALAVGLVIYWLVTPTELVFQHAGMPGFPVWDIGFGVRLMGILISAAPLACLIYGLLQARRCFDASAAGGFFTAEPARGLRSFAIAIVVSTALKPIAGALLSVLLSWSSQPGRKTLILSVSSDTLLALIFAGLIAVIAWVMTQASALADENAQFV